MQTKPRTKSMTVKTLVPFLALTFGLTWGIAALLILFTDQIIAIFGEISMTNPLFILAVYAPGIAGVFLVWWHYRFRGLVSFLRRLTLWRMSIVWWLFLILGIPAIMYAGVCVERYNQRPVSLLPLVPGASGAGTCLVSRTNRGVWMAWTRSASVPTQVQSILGWPDPRSNSGSLAHSRFPA